MGVVNVTPDSFSDAGEFFDPRDAQHDAKLREHRRTPQVLDADPSAVLKLLEQPGEA